MLRILLTGLLLLHLSTSTFAESWTAQWITSSNNPRLEQTNIWTCFRKTVSIDEVPSKVQARIATDSKYWLWVNGELIVFEGQLKRGPTPQDTYFDEVDIASALKPGNNTIALLSWYWGKDGFSHKSSGRPGILFEADIPGTILRSDTTWRSMIHPAYGNTGPPYPNYRLPESNILFDARKDISGWERPDFNDSAWSQAVVVCNAPCSPWNSLWPRPIPLWKFSNYLDYKEIKQVPGASGSVFIGNLPQNLAVTPYMEVDAEAGLKIDVQTDNYHGGSENNVRAEYVTRKGVQEYEFLGYMNGHEVHYKVPKGVKVLALKYRESRYDTDLASSFDCDDAFYNILWKKARNTMTLNMRDSIQDPDRERAQWWGDAVIVSGQIFYACDRRAHQLVRKAISNLVEWRKPGGVLYSPVPSGNWNKELPAQMLAAVGKYGLWNYYMHSGDLSTIRNAYPAVSKYLSLWKLDSDGLAVHRTGDWDWLDWGGYADVSVLENAWLYMALDTRANVAGLLGKSQDVKECRIKMQKIKGGFNRRFWNGKEYRSPNHTGKVDDRGNGLAVIAGLADSTKWPAIKTVLSNQMNSSPYMEKYVLESLLLMNDTKGALARMKKRYSEMVSSPLTTLWEGWQIGARRYGGGSYNHGWAGGPLILLSQYVVGVAPEEPGYTVFHVLPQPGHLKNVRATIPTVRGSICVEWIQGSNSFGIRLSSPPGSTAHVGIPKLGGKTASSVQVNGTFVWRNGKAAQETADIKVEGTSDNHVIFRTLPGTYRFEANFSSPSSPE